MIVTASAPTRIDLAGGTTDIWPMYLFYPNARTVNLAIDLRAKAVIEQVGGNAIEIKSEDQGVSHRLPSIDFVDEIENGHPLELVLRLLAFFKPEGGLTIQTSCASPAGAGLGGSSALTVALSGALNAITGGKFSREELLTVAKNVETQVLKIPAGVQDYYPAMYGGLNTVLLEPIGESLLRHSHILAHQIESRMILVYSGQSRNSGINNWSVMRRFFDGDEKVRAAMSGIQEATKNLELALKTNRYEEATNAINREMENRERLSESILTDEIKNLFTFARERGAKAAKICGAGGGGCAMLWTNPSDKHTLIKALREKEFKVLDFHVDSDGLSVTTR
ncbi:MAG: GHMP kinase [Oligoflexia bacterium]|nr:GHMP kinase [Oligoflexia bacterium]